jgi:TPR repeat protein
MEYQPAFTPWLIVKQMPILRAMKFTLERAVLALVLVLSVAAPVAAGPLDDGIVAYHAGDYASALRLIRPFAEQGVARAQYNLGVMYAEGRGVAQDYTEAIKWYGKAADQGYSDAEYNLGVMYEAGRGVTQDFAAAANWYRKAADQGDAEAQFNLGVMYYKGLGVPQDYVMAHMWSNLSAAAGNQDAARDRDIIAGLMTTVQIAEAQRLAREWKPIAPMSR